MDNPTAVKSKLYSLPKGNRFTGKDAHSIAELLQQDNPGLKFLPLRPDTKGPATEHGWKDCTDDLSSLWELTDAGHGLGIVLGGKPYFALDVDTKKQHRGATGLCKYLGYIIPIDMTETAAVELLIEKLDTLIGRSPSGGLHIYWKHPFDYCVAFPGRPEGSDFRGGVGYLVFPGTHTKEARDDKGNIKTYEGTYEVVKDRPIALAPQAILDALVDIGAPVEKKAGAAIGEPVKLKEFIDVLAYVDPDHSRERWIVQAGCFHNTNLVDAEGDEIGEEEKLDLWLRFCRGDLWKGSRADWKMDSPSYYTGDNDAEIGWGQIGQKEGGAGYGSLVHEAKANGYNRPSMLDNDDFELPEVTTAKAREKTLYDQLRESLLTSDQLDAETGLTEFLVDDWLPFEGNAYVFGKRGGGKTAAIVDLCLNGQADRKWMGVHDIEKGCTFIYIALEHRTGVNTSIQAWKSAHPDVRINPRRFMVCSYPINAFVENPGEIMKTLAQVIRDTMDHSRVIFVFDTQQRFAPGDQNKEDKMATASAVAESYAQEFKGASIILGHSPKSNEETLSGSGILENNSFSLIALNKTGTGKLREMRVIRIKDAPEESYSQFEIVGQVIPGLDKKGQPRTGGVVRYRAGSTDSGQGLMERQAEAEAKANLLAEDIFNIMDAGQFGLEEVAIKCAYKPVGTYGYLEGSEEPGRKLGGRSSLLEKIAALAGTVWPLHGGTHELEVIRGTGKKGPGSSGKVIIRKLLPDN